METHSVTWHDCEQELLISSLKFRPIFIHMELVLGTGKCSGKLDSLFAYQRRLLVSGENIPKPISYIIKA